VTRLPLPRIDLLKTDRWMPLQHHDGRAVAGKLQGEGRTPAANGNERQFAHRHKLGAWPGRTIGQKDLTHGGQNP